jgi:hypothetical protein
MATPSTGLKISESHFAPRSQAISPLSILLFVSPGLVGASLRDDHKISKQGRRKSRNLARRRGSELSFFPECLPDIGNYTTAS